MEQLVDLLGSITSSVTADLPATSVGSAQLGTAQAASFSVPVSNPPSPPVILGSTSAQSLNVQILYGPAWTIQERTEDAITQFERSEFSGTGEPTDSAGGTEGDSSLP